MNILFVALFGAIIGSFLNVYICRLHTGKKLGGRSHCLSCGQTLAWFELLPVVSYVLQVGRCRACNARIAARYLFVEVVTIVLFVLSHLVGTDWLTTGLLCVVSAALVVIVTYDLMHTIIPDEMVALLGLTSLLLFIHQGLPLSYLFAGVVAGLFFWFFWFVSKGRWMGLGDAKLALPLGVLLGPWGAVSMIILSFWIGAIVSVGIIALQTGKTHMPFLSARLTMKSEIPFAPFLILGFVCVYFFHVDILTITDSVTKAFLGY